jgi:hypothetical protein
MKKFKSIIYFVSICYLSYGLLSCDTVVKTPDNLIDKNKMVAIMTEIQLAESAIGLQPLSHAQAITRFTKYETDIFKKYQTDSTTYFSSYKYYAAQGKVLQYMYSIVTDSIIMQKDRAEKYARLDSAKRGDSLKIILMDSIAKINDSVQKKNVKKTTKKSK